HTGDSRLTQDGAAVGTFQYLSPEACDGQLPDERSDIWSFGVMVYEMLTGAPPFRGETPAAVIREILNSPPPELTRYRDDVPPELSQLLQRMLAKNAVMRLSSFRQVGAELEAILRGGKVPHWPEASILSNPQTVIEADAKTSEPLTPRLLTKLYTPVPRPNLVSRARLLTRLDEGMTHQHPLLLVCAPAGFGKTTLVSEWISRQSVAVAWLALDAEDNDPIQFFSYLIAALQRLQPGCGETTRQLLQAPQMPPVQTLIAPLINDLAAAAETITLVLDDYHLISSALIHQSLEFLLERCPPNLHLVMTTREDPPFPLARLRVRNQVTEIRERDLRVTTAETAAFLTQTMNLHLPPDVVAALATRTEGWMAGLQLAALALRENPDEAGTFVEAFTGDDRYIVDYLVTEVLAHQPEDIRDFLRQTSILDRLTASLCNAVTRRDDSHTLLERLEAANLFLMPLDHRREWFRYYHLFAECLQSGLESKEAAALHQRAAQWYETHGYNSPAIHHALTAAALTGDYGEAGRLITAAADDTFERGEILTLGGWLAALPETLIRANGDLATYKGWVLMLSGQVTEAETAAAAAEVVFHELAITDTRLGRLFLLRCYIALSRQDYEVVTELAANALRHFEEKQIQWRIMALWVLAEAQERTRSVTEAITSLREAGRVGRGSGNQISSLLIDNTLTAALNENGQRQVAVTICEEILAHFPDQQKPLSPLVGIILVRLAALEYEANQLDQAARHLEQGRDLCEQIAVNDLLSFAYGISSWLLSAQGEADAAVRMLQKARQYLAEESLSDAGWLNAWEITLNVRRGQLGGAQRCVEAAGLLADSTPRFLRVEEHLAYVRLLLAQNRLDTAREWLARLEGFLRERDLTRWLITAHILQVLVAERSGHHADALKLLSQAVSLAAPENYARAFLDEEAQVLGLLPAVRQIAPAFVAQLVGDMAVTRSKSGGMVQALVEPLSERELEVLRLIAAGYANSEIGEKLFITVGTVKRHINHIYDKLAVHSRTQAILKARELKLWQDAGA
ncbi:MAG TPA: LuxR C-terminal-related transcriptional regulator, partial [Phototrophicaceae bacterium]|nr:LuxR C-terminal-related transcriptional regulator [Phototrophicaceae bacterium]